MGELIRYGRDDDAEDQAFWRGYRQAKKALSNFERGKRAGKLELVWSVLRLVQVVIMAFALVIVFHGCEVLRDHGLSSMP